MSLSNNQESTSSTISFPTLHRITNNLTLLADGFYIPKNNPSKPLGQDSYFINNESKVIGVADGVGSWSKKGIDAGEYARELMTNAASASAGFDPVDPKHVLLTAFLSTESLGSSTAAASASAGFDPVDPKHVLLTAFLSTESLGSSTACIVSLDGNLLRAVNLGDSGFLVIREGKTVYKSPVQQYRFNSPYQIGSKRNRGPEQADEIAMAMEEGDVVIVGTDGLFDNIFVEGIEEIVERCMTENLSPDHVASELAEAAHRQSLQRNTVSPFEVAAREARVPHVGGKYDDITVVAAYVFAAS